MGLEKFWVKKMTCQKMFLIQKMSGSKNFGPKELWSLKKSLLKNLGSKRNYHLQKLPKDFKSKKIWPNFGSGKIWVQRSWVQKMSQDQFGVKGVGQKKIVGPKKLDEKKI